MIEVKNASMAVMMAETVFIKIVIIIKVLILVIINLTVLELECPT